MSRQETKTLVRGAVLLTVAGLVSKVLSASYRIPLQNLTGDVGFYIYQQVYPLLGIIVILSLYGFPSAVSKMTVDMKAAGKQPTWKQFYFPVFLLLLLLNGSLFSLLYLNAGPLARWIGDTSLTRAYQLAACAFLLVPFTSLLRGSFQGSYQMKPTAYSQIGEQLVRVTLIILGAYAFYRGQITSYEIGEVAAVAALAGAGVAVIILSLFLIRQQRPEHQAYRVPWGYYMRTLVALGIVAALNHMILLIIQFADVFTLVPQLMAHGHTQLEAMAAKGVFDRGQPLIQLGTVLGSSLALTLIPSVSQQKLAASRAETVNYIQSGLVLNFYLAAGATLGLIFIFPEVNVLLFKDLQGTVSLQILAGAILLSSLAITGTSILQGLGYFKQTALFIVAAFAVKWVLNTLLVPLWGITGSALATVVSLLALCVLVFFYLRRQIPTLQAFKKLRVTAFGLASLAMGLYLMLMKHLLPYELIDSRLLLLGYVIFVALTGALVYLLLLLRCRAFTEAELAMLPSSSLLIKIHRGREDVEK